MDLRIRTNLAYSKVSSGVLPHVCQWGGQRGRPEGEARGGGQRGRPEGEAKGGGQRGRPEGGGQRMRSRVYHATITGSI